MAAKTPIYVDVKRNGEWIEIPFPESLNIDWQELVDDEAGRSLAGDMDKGDGLGLLYVLSMDYEMVTQFTTARLSCIKKQMYIDVRFFSPATNRYENVTMFTGNPSYSFVGWGGKNDDVCLYDAHFEFTQKKPTDYYDIPNITDIPEGE
jgi:hypothetical protein